MLKDFVGTHIYDDPGLAKPPEQFLNLDEVIQALDKLDFERVLLEGQEASIDPRYPELTEILHKRYGSYNVLLSNLYELPDLKDTDKVAFGIKAVTNSLHKDYTGVSNERILRNFINLYHRGVKMIVESVVIPGYIDIEETERIAKYIGSLDEEIPYVLLPYFKAGDNPWRRPTPKEMEKAADRARKYLKNVYFFRGDEEIQQEVFSIFPAESDLDCYTIPYRKGIPTLSSNSQKEIIKEAIKIGMT